MGTILSTTATVIIGIILVLGVLYHLYILLLGDGKALIQTTANHGDEVIEPHQFIQTCAIPDNEHHVKAFVTTLRELIRATDPGAARTIYDLDVFPAYNTVLNEACDGSCKGFWTPACVQESRNGIIDIDELCSGLAKPEDPEAERKTLKQRAILFNMIADLEVVTEIGGLGLKAPTTEHEKKGKRLVATAAVLGVTKELLALSNTTN